MRTHHRLLLILGVAMLFPGHRAFAQAWVGERNTGWAALEYSYVASSDLIEQDGVRVEDEELDTHQMTLRLGYSPIERLGLELAASYLAMKYGGEGMLFPSHGEYDDGDFHGTLQDVAFRARYQLLEELFAFAPHVGVTIPMSDYEVFGWANAGRHLKALLVGASAGKFFFRRLFVHAAYEFAVPEKFDDMEGFDKYSQLRSDLALVIGLFALDRLELHGAVDFHWQHGGVDFLDLTDRDSPLFLNHDPVLNEDFVQAGGGVAWNATDQLKVGLEARMFVNGRNTLDRRTVTLGLTYDIH
jgi:hypothetical protein